MVNGILQQEKKDGVYGICCIDGINVIIIDQYVDDDYGFLISWKMFC